MSTDELTRQIIKLEKEAIKLDPDAETRTRWLNKVGKHAENFLSQLSEMPTKEPIHDDNPFLAHPVGESGISLETALELIRSEIERSGLKPASAGYLAYIPGGGIYPSALGDYLAATGNHYSGFHFASPGGVRMENQLIKWVASLIGFDPEQAGGNFASGGSYAALIAVHTAREVHQIRSRDIEKLCIYATSQAHHTIFKALRVAGMKEAHIRQIEMDDGFRMKPDSLRRAIKLDVENGFQPFMVVASAGTTDTGSMDPLDEIGQIAASYDIWFHVDAAYGGFFLLTDLLRTSFEGIARADSVVIDPHKGLFVPYGTGMVILKKREHLLGAHTADASYLQDLKASPDELSPADLSPELSRHFRGLRVWLPLQLFGLQPFRAALTEKRLLCLWLFEKVKSLPHFETGPVPDLSVFIFRCIPPSGDVNLFNQRFIQAIQDDGRTFLSSTTINDTFWIRVAILNFRTHMKEVSTCLEILKDYSTKFLAPLHKKFESNS